MLLFAAYGADGLPSVMWVYSALRPLMEPKPWMSVNISQNYLWLRACFHLAADFGCSVGMYTTLQISVTSPESQTVVP